jgi:hypothetical protein
MRRLRSFSAYNEARFRVTRAEKAWAELVEVLRSAAAEPDYRGPDLRAVEWLGDEITMVRQALREWATEEVLRRRRVRRLSSGRARAVVDAISSAAGRE